MSHSDHLQTCRKDAKAQRLDRNALDELSRIIVTKAIHVHRQLGPGLLERIYKPCLTHELRKAGLHVLVEQPVPVYYDGLELGEGYRLDLLVEDEIVLEIKAIEKLLPVHTAQLLSYLKLTDKRLGLLLNFNAPRLVQGLKRVVNQF
jgi:GxxExxY protein